MCKCHCMWTHTVEGWGKKEQGEQNCLNQRLQAHCKPLSSSVHLGVKANPPLQFIGPWFVYLPTESSSKELWVCRTEAPECYLLLGTGKHCVGSWIWKAKTFAPHFSTFSEYREIVPIVLHSWHSCLALKQLEDCWCSAFCLTDTCPQRSCSAYRESVHGLHLLQYIYVNERQLQNYIQIITIMGNRLQKRQSAWGVRRAWKCLSNKCNK